MKQLTTFGGFVFLGGCILLSAYSVSYSMNSGRHFPIFETLGIACMVAGGLMGFVGLAGRHISKEKLMSIFRDGL